MQPIDYEPLFMLSDEERYYRSILQQINRQSCIFAGLVFTGLAAAALGKYSGSAAALTAFDIVASLSVSLFLTASFASGILRVLGDRVSLVGRFDTQVSVSWFTYVGGIAAFVAALVLLAWAAIPPLAAFTVTMIGILSAAGMALFLFHTAQTVQVSDRF